MSQEHHRRRRSDWKRLFVWVVMPVVLGIVTTVGVAWWGALRPAPKLLVGRKSADNGGHLTTFIERSTPHRVSRSCLILGRTERIIGTATTAQRPDHFHDGTVWGRFVEGQVPRLNERQRTVVEDGGAVLIQDAASGWPMLALWSSNDMVDESYRANTASPLAGATTPLWEVTRREVGGRAFPYRPLWPGFAVNSVLFAAVWFVLLGPTLAGLNTMQRRSRLRRGLCAGCGYDLKDVTGDVCPECGGKMYDYPSPVTS